MRPGAPSGVEACVAWNADAGTLQLGSLPDRRLNSTSPADAGLVRYGLVNRLPVAVSSGEGVDQAQQLLLGLKRHTLDEPEPAFEPRTNGRYCGLALGAEKNMARCWYDPSGDSYKREDTGLGIVGTRRTLYIGNIEIVIENGTTTYKRTIGGALVQHVVNGIAEKNICLSITSAG